MYTKCAQANCLVRALVASQAHTVVSEKSKNQKKETKIPTHVLQALYSDVFHFSVNA